jgi:hypothetical protein
VSEIYRDSDFRQAVSMRLDENKSITRQEIGFCPQSRKSFNKYEWKRRKRRDDHERWIRNWLLLDLMWIYHVTVTPHFSVGGRDEAADGEMAAWDARVSGGELGESSGDRAWWTAARAHAYSFEREF